MDWKDWDLMHRDIWCVYCQLKQNIDVQSKIQSKVLLLQGRPLDYLNEMQNRSNLTAIGIPDPQHLTAIGIPEPHAKPSSVASVLCRLRDLAPMKTLIKMISLSAAMHQLPR